ncbi:type I phosphomannose isomerase catalytic subunit [Candidatus Pantoea edessiphila]|uniref:type I phosphomannose isomerase catalytic subunit n=1 Tax=Candidatus Pantoea edessiphila TaxID=2044610 RepID=UPI003BB09A86
MPFLFKILCIEHPLFIQILAQKGFVKENILLIIIDSYQRNYKDNNYKPELIYVVTVFYALIGFRDFSKIILLLNTIIGINPLISKFQNQPNNCNLLKLLKYFLCLKDYKKLMTFNIINI